ncbi:MAG TPA: HDIG domain-containing protein [Anaerolineaceae bacterium]|jgi:putative nucleotidyltransferase with HDIG domain|nr:HDIG domain-containing protein [Anaerolineaceae bacterium]
MQRQQALEIVRAYVRNEALVRHMLSVEAVMRAYAQNLHEDVELWGLAGLLHDFDWEIHPTAEEHPLAGLPILREAGVPEAVLEAIAGHADHTGVPRESRLAKALFACDEITGLITAVALVRPSRSLYDLEVSSVRKKWKDKSFAAGADRDVIAQGAQEFGVDLWQHVDFVIKAMRNIAKDLDLEGSLSLQDPMD